MMKKRLETDRRHVHGGHSSGLWFSVDVKAQMLTRVLIVYLQNFSILKVTTSFQALEQILLNDFPVFLLEIFGLFLWEVENL